MDLSPTPAQDTFRRELREWLRANLPWEYGVGLPPRFTELDEEVAFLRAWQAKLAAGRWAGVASPEEPGGRDRPSTTSSRKSWRAHGHPSCSDASASTSPVPHCSPMAPRSRKSAG